MKAVNGHIIHGTSICVDYWMWTPYEQYIHFLSHLHADHTVNLKASFQGIIYTSPFNAWLVKRWFNISEDSVVSLSVGASHILYDKNTQSHFSITLLDANHCPGSVMFLFQGEFGNILYTGDFRYNPDVLEHPMLKSVIDNKCIHRLYLDNTFAAEHCEFPPRQQVLQEIINLIRSHPEHHVVIGIRKLGKEEVLRAIALNLKEKILVSKDRLKILSFLQYEDVFTTVPDESRILVKEIHQINSSYLNRLQEEMGPVLTILLTALYTVMPPSLKSTAKWKNAVDGVHHLPYSDHSCHSELVEFVSRLKPHKIYPIVKIKMGNDTQTRDLDPSAISEKLLQKFSWCNSLIPQSIMGLSKSPFYIDDFQSEIPNLELEVIQDRDINSSQLTEDESPCQSPGSFKWMTDIQVLDSTEDNLNMSMTTLNEGTPISEDELTQINVDANDALRKNNDMELPDIRNKKDIVNKKYEAPTLSVSPQIDSPPRPKRICLYNLNKSEEIKCYTPGSPTPEKTNLILKVKSNRTLNEILAVGEKSDENKRNFKFYLNKITNTNKVDEYNEIVTSHYKNHCNVDSSLQFNPEVLSTPIKKCVPNKSASFKLTISTPEIIGNHLFLEHNLRNHSKTHNTEVDSEKPILSVNHLKSMTNSVITNSASVINNTECKSKNSPQGKHKLYLENMNKNVEITVKFKDPLTDPYQCVPDSLYNALSLTNDGMVLVQNKDSSPGRLNNSLLHDQQSISDSFDIEKTNSVLLPNAQSKQIPTDIQENNSLLHNELFKPSSCQIDENDTLLCNKNNSLFSNIQSESIQDGIEVNNSILRHQNSQPNSSEIEENNALLSNVQSKTIHSSKGENSLLNDEHSKKPNSCSIEKRNSIFNCGLFKPNHCDIKNIPKSCFKQSGSTFYSDVGKGLYRQWKAQVQKKKINELFWGSDYNWQEIFSEK